MKNSRLTWQKATPFILFAGGIIGLAASFALTYDKLHVLQNPEYLPACNLSPILSCGSVMKTSQAMLLGVPNTIFGLIAFSMLTMFGLVLLGGATLKRWLWVGAQLVATAGLVFMHYLLFESVFRIHAICPWCFVVWMITMPIFMAVTVHNLRTGNLYVSRSRRLAKLTGWISKNSFAVLALWYVLVLTLLLCKFWYYWQTLL